MAKGAESSIERVVVVTGAASGIGAAVVRRIAGPGAALLLHTRRNREALARVAAAAREKGAESEIVLADLAEAGAAKRLVEAALERFGRLDQIVSNAGAGDRRGFGEVDEAGLRRAEAAMPEAFFALAQAALEPLRASSWGRVVAVSSFVAHRFGLNGFVWPATAAAKAGLEALAKTLAFQLAPHGVTVNCVAPGYTRKDATGHSALTEEAWRRIAAAIPMGRIAVPDEIAAVIAFLLGRDAAYVTGQVIHVDGGMTLT